jgi:glycosyltransferase involved in cell wall biosynthesis
MPKVSVVMPVFNALETIRRAIRSVLNQTIADLELIVVDDGSTDGTAEFVRGINDVRIRLVRCAHRGVAAAANTGTEVAIAPLIARMDADDFAYPQRLAKQLRLLRENDFDVVGCRVRIADRAGKRIESMARYERWINEDTVTPHQIFALRFVELPLVNPTIVARREYFEMGYLENDLPEDYDLMLRAAACGLRFGKTREVLFDWSDRPKRLTRVDARYTLDAFARCRQKHLLAGPLQGRQLVDVWGIGQTGKPWLRWLQSQGIRIRYGYEVNPRKIDTHIHGVRVLHFDAMRTADGTPLIIAVGAEGARELILPQIQSRGYESGRDAWFVA